MGHCIRFHSWKCFFSLESKNFWEENNAQSCGPNWRSCSKLQKVRKRQDVKLFPMQELEVCSRTSMRQRCRTWNEDPMGVGDTREKKTKVRIGSHWEFCYHQSVKLEMPLIAQHKEFGYIIDSFMPSSYFSDGLDLSKNHILKIIYIQLNLEHKVPWKLSRSGRWANTDREFLDWHPDSLSTRVKEWIHGQRVK